jgi:hypothetical protein
VQYAQYATVGQSGLAVASLVVGIVSIVINAVVPIIGLFVGVVGIVLGALARRRAFLSRIVDILRAPTTPAKATMAVRA